MNAEANTDPTPSNEKNGKEEPAKASFFHIDKDMLPFKAHYFLLDGSLAATMTYIPVVAKNRLELSATSAASVLTVGLFISVFSRPIIGYLADYFNKLKLIINVLLILQGVSTFLILVVPPIERSPTLRNDSTDHSMNSSDSPALPGADSLNDFTTLTFWMFALLLVISNVCSSSLFTLSDTACYESVEKYRRDFGRQRLFGALGWGTIAPIGGLLCDLTKDYIATWVLMAVLRILNFWNIYHMDMVKPHFSQNLLRDVGKVLKNAEFIIFDLGVFMNGMSAGILWFYLVWFLSGLGASKFLCGLLNYVQCYVGEIPFMFFSGWVVEKVGHFNLVSLSLLAYAVRFLWYSYLQNPWLVLPAEITHGFTYGLLFPAIGSYGKLSAKPGTEATTQSVLFTTHGGLGAGVGCVFAGIGFDYLGGHQTFFIVGILGFCAALLNVFNIFLLKRRSSKALAISLPEK